VRGNLVPDVAAALRTYADACTNPRSADLDGLTATHGGRNFQADIDRRVSV
jgi:hypothetical protein